MAKSESKPDSTKTDLAKLEAYITKVISEDFPTLEIADVTSYDTDEAGDIVGIFIDKEKREYTFVIEKASPHPILRRI